MPTTTVAVPAPVMPTVPRVLAPPAAILVSVVEVAGVGVIPRPAKTEDFHDHHIFILSFREIISQEKCVTPLAISSQRVNKTVLEKHQNWSCELLAVTPRGAVDPLRRPHHQRQRMLDSPGPALTARSRKPPRMALIPLKFACRDPDNAPDKQAHPNRRPGGAEGCSGSRGTSGGGPPPQIGVCADGQMRDDIGDGAAVGLAVQAVNVAPSRYGENVPRSRFVRCR
jgi:hypothetical protein